MENEQSSCSLTPSPIISGLLDEASGPVLVRKSDAFGASQSFKSHQPPWGRIRAPMGRKIPLKVPGREFGRRQFARSCRRFLPDAR